jgi:hypothetical protein
VEGLNACPGEAGLTELVGDMSGGLGRGLLVGAWAAWLRGDRDTSAWPEQGAYFDEALRWLWPEAEGVDGQGGVEWLVWLRRFRPTPLVGEF